MLTGATPATRSGDEPRLESATGWRMEFRRGLSDALTTPMQRTIVMVAVTEGAGMAAGDLIVVFEAMKTEQPLNANKPGMVTGLSAKVGATVTNGCFLCEIKD